jgi:hypothetical protein
MLLGGKRWREGARGVSDKVGGAILSIDADGSLGQAVQLKPMSETAARPKNLSKMSTLH